MSKMHCHPITCINIICYFVLGIWLIIIIQQQQHDHIFRVNAFSSTTTTSTPSSSSSSSSTTSTNKNNIVVYGPKSRELLLLVSKIAASKQYCHNTVNCICAPGTEDGCRGLMYGKDYAAAKQRKDLQDYHTHAKPISSPRDISMALENTNSLLLIGYDEPIETSTLETFFKYTNVNKLQHVILISQMGITNNNKYPGGGFFGGGGGSNNNNDNKYFRSEQELQKIIQSHNPKLTLHIVRAGILKGGGPGIPDDGNDDTTPRIQEEIALDKCYYNTILDVVEAKVTMAHDKYALGANTDSIVVGDPNTVPNFIQRLATKSSFDPSPTDTNRIVVASAVVAILNYCQQKNKKNNNDPTATTPIELSVGTASGKKIPTPTVWSQLLKQILSTSTTTSATSSNSIDTPQQSKQKA